MLASMGYSHNMDNFTFISPSFFVCKPSSVKEIIYSHGWYFYISLLQAPIITIPAHSQSDVALVTHLGVLSVNNVFYVSKDNVKSKDGVPAVLDHMTVSLTDLQVQRYALYMLLWWNTITHE